MQIKQIYKVLCEYKTNASKSNIEQVKWEIGYFLTFGKFRKVLKKQFKKEKKSSLKGGSQFLALEPRDSAFTKVILHGCMIDIHQLCCITYTC